MERKGGIAWAPPQENKPAPFAGKERPALLAEMKEEALALKERLKAWLALEKEGSFGEVAAGVFSCLARMEELRARCDALGPAKEEERALLLPLLYDLKDLHEENERLLSGIREKLSSWLLEVKRARELGSYLKQTYLQEKYSLPVPLVDVER